AFEIHSDGITVKERKRKDRSTILTLSFHGRGQKSLRLAYNGKRWTNLHFYCVEDAEQLLKARARSWRSGNSWSVRTIPTIAIICFCPSTIGARRAWMTTMMFGK